MRLTPFRFPCFILPACLFVAILPVTGTVAVRLLLLALTLISAIDLRRRETMPDLPGRAVLYVWAALAIGSLAWSIDPEYSRREAINEIGYSMITFFSFFSLSRREEDIRLVLRALVASIGLVSMFAIVNFLTHNDWHVGESIGVGDRNAFSTTVALTFPALIFVLANRRLGVAPGPLVWLVLASSAVAGALTLNRTMWPAIAAAMIVFLIARNAKRLNTARNRLIAVTVAAIIAGVGATQFLAVSKFKRHDLGPSADALTKLQRDERFRIWAYAMERAKERPLYGFGYGRGILRQDFRTTLGFETHWHAHNVFLNQMIELGLPGLAAYCAVLIALGVAFLRLCRDGASLTRSLGAFGLALLVSVVVRSLADDTIVRENALLFWSLAGLTLGAGARLTAAQPRPGLVGN